MTLNALITQRSAVRIRPPLLKGAIRARAEKILRTLFKTEILDNDPAFLTNDLFGTTEAAGRLRVDDIYQSGNTVEAVKWTAEDKTTMDNATVHQDHVAMDRFTGGASDSALFNTRTPKRDKTWEPFKLSVDFSRPIVQKKSSNKKVESIPLTPEKKFFLTAMVLLVLRDLAAGLVPVGFGSRRGMGEIKVEKITITGAVAGVSFENKTLNDALNEQSLKNAWVSFVSPGKGITNPTLTPCNVSNNEE